MVEKIPFISGLPRSGSTLLAAILRQNLRFHAGMNSPVCALVERMLEAISENNEYSILISPEQKQALIQGIFSAYYQPQAGKGVIFNSNRLLFAKLSNYLRLQKFFAVSAMSPG